MSKNDITGDAIISKANNQTFRDNFDNIFKKKECKRCGKTLAPEGTYHIHTCTPKEILKINHAQN